MMTVIYVVGWIVALRLAYEFLGEQGAGMWFAVALALLNPSRASACDGPALAGRRRAEAMSDKHERGDARPGVPATPEERALPADLASLGPIPPPPGDLPERFRASWGPATSAEGPWLRVRNAKNTNGRSHGDFRYLDLSPLSAADRATIRKWMAVVAAAVRAGTADKLIQRCTEALSRINESLWPRREAGYTLYAARHQFAANAKAVGVSPVYVAALMGHAVDRTACSHYARRQRNEVFRPIEGTWTISGVPRPLPGDILRVRETEMVDVGAFYHANRPASVEAEPPEPETEPD